MAEIWREILDLDTFGPSDDFFELGGDSLAGTALMLEIELGFGLKLPLSILLEAPTIAALSTLIVEGIGATQAPILVPIDPAGARAPIFIVHGLHGQVLFARHLRGRLGESRPIYGLQAPIAPRPDDDPDSVAGIAAQYLDAVRRARPHGPYILAGYCAGTLIAWEMAQQLSAVGESAAALIGIDPPMRLQGNVGRPVSVPEGVVEDPEAFREEARATITAMAQRHADPTVIGRGTEAVEQAVTRAERLRRILVAYRPATYAGRVAFICSAPRAGSLKRADCPWRGLLPPTARIRVAGDGHSDLFRNRSEFVAQAVRHELEELDL